MVSRKHFLTCSRTLSAPRASCSWSTIGPSTSRVGNKTYYTQLRLDPLGKESADEMLTALLGDEPELAPLNRSS